MDRGVFVFCAKADNTPLAEALSQVPERGFV